MMEDVSAWQASAACDLVSPLATNLIIRIKDPARMTATTMKALLIIVVVD
jgi:hypothetical protein